MQTITNRAPAAGRLHPVPADASSAVLPAAVLPAAVGGVRGLVHAIAPHVVLGLTAWRAADPIDFVPRVLRA